MVEISFGISNENTVKRFLDNLQSFARHKFDIAVKCSTEKIRHLFCWKDKNSYPDCKIYEGNCSCSANYIGEKRKKKEISGHGGMHMRIQIKILNNLNTSENFLILNPIGKYFLWYRQTQNNAKLWNHQ